MFEIYKSKKSGEFYFRLKARNHQIILTSEGYRSKRSCQNGIESVRKNSKVRDGFEIKTARNGKFHFNLRARNGEIVGSSQMYKSRRNAQKGIDSVKKNAPKGAVKEIT